MLNNEVFITGLVIQKSHDGYFLGHLPERK